MLYEIWPERLSELPAGLQSAVDAWTSSRPVAAYQLLSQLGRRKSPGFNPDLWNVEGSWLFAIDVANGCGLYEQAERIADRGVAAFPQSSWLQLLHAWNQAAKGLLFDCRERLDRLEPSLSHELQATLHAIHAYNYAVSGWRISAERAQERAAELGAGDVVASYILSRAAARRSEWDLAVKLGRQVVDLEPRWTRARGALIDSVLARNELDEARRLFESIPSGSLPFYALPLSESFLCQALGEVSRAIELLGNLHQSSPLNSRLQRFCCYQLATLLQFEGRDAEADALIRDQHLPKMKFERGTGTRKKYLNLPLVSQNFNHCVPTVAAMAAMAQGIPANPQQYAAGMETRHGTALWRMVDFMKQNGFAAYCLKPEFPVIEHVLEAGIPLIGSLNGLFSSHVDILCGFDERLRLVHYRDPMHWIGRSMAYDNLCKKYRNSEGLWAFVAADRVGTLGIEPNWLDGPGLAMVNLQRACALGSRLEAEAAFQQIPDPHPLAVQRDQIARGIVLTPTEFDRRLAQHATLTEPYETERLRAILMHLDDRNAQPISELFESKRAEFGDSFVDFVQAQCLVARHCWSEAESVLQRVRRKIPQVEAVWGISSDVQEQLGNRQQALHCIQNALDIAPDNLRYQRRLLDLQSLTLPYEERLQRVRKIFDSPNEPQYLSPTLAEVFEDGPDGLEFEAALRDCIKWFPRSPYYYHRLANWYMTQSRPDLAGALLRQARELMGEAEIPFWDFESPMPLATSAPETNPAPTHAGSPADSPPARVEAPGRNSAEPPDPLTAALQSTQQQTFAQAWENPQIQDCLAQEQSGQLAWLQAVRLRSVLLQLALRELRERGVSPEGLTAVRKALPESAVPGLPEIYAQALFDSLDGARIDGEAAALLLDWLVRTCPNYERRAGLAFERAWLLELQEKLTEAEGELDKLTVAHPAYAPAWFRKGMIADSRRDFEQARKYLNRALEVAPGLNGAMAELDRLLDFLQADEALSHKQRFARLFPYSAFRHYAVAGLIARRANSAQPGLDYLVQVQNLTGEIWGALLRARLLADHKQFDEALQVIAGREIPADLKTMADWIQVDALVDRNQFREALEILNPMLEREPQSESITDQIVRCLREISPEQARQFAEKKLIEGWPVVIFGYIATAGDQPPHLLAQKLILQAPTDRQPALADCFAEVFEIQERAASLLPYLEWITQHLPSLIHLQEKLAYRYYLLGKSAQAIQLAETLWKASPDEPRRLRLMGDCLQDQNPKKAIEYLQKELEQTGRADSMTRLARAHQLAENHADAKRLYRLALSKNPLDALAITNLHFRYQELDDPLFQMACRIVERGFGLHDQYFLVAIVQMALKKNATVPVQWLQLALDRQRVITTEGSFLDEPKRLRRAIAAWSLVRPADLADDTPQPHGWDRLLARWHWPGTRWIPKS